MMVCTSILRRLKPGLGVWELLFQCWFNIDPSSKMLGGGPRVVVSTAAFHASVRGSFPGLGGLKKNKNVSSPSTRKTQYCGEPLSPRGSVLGLRPPGFKFCVWRAVSSHSSHHPLRRFSWPNLTCIRAQKWHKTRFILFCLYDAGSMISQQWLDISCFLGY